MAQLHVPILVNWNDIKNHMEKHDIVEVVRCKECKHRPSDPKGNNYGQDLVFPCGDYKCPCRCDDSWYSWMPKDDWFCANGERSE